MHKFATLIAVVVQLSAALPAAAEARRDQILMQGNPAGTQTVTAQGANRATAEFAFNDRGRGDHITAAWRLDAAGVPTEYQGHGNDYMKSPVAETFRIVGGKASWSNRAEHGDASINGEAFYIPANAPPEFTGVLARALLKSPSHRLALLPAGEAGIESAGSLTMTSAGGATRVVTQYRITGLDFSPTPVWLDQNGNTAALVSGWLVVLSPSDSASLSALLDAQANADGEWALRLAKQQTHMPTGPLVIRNARLFDPRDLSVTPGMSVVISGSHVERVTPDTALALPDGAEIIDARGRFLMPGLWDNHQHFSGIDGAHQNAGGFRQRGDR